MSHETTTDEQSLFNDITAHAGAVWKNSVGMTGRSNDPKMFSVMLFKRLWSNHRGYIVLWNCNLQTESDIILRSAIEASICLAANYKLRDKFVQLLHGDAIFTLKGQIKMWRDEGSMDMVRESEAVLRDTESRFRGDTKPARLDWKSLAAAGEVPSLYGWHRMLSGLSSHVTGASILTAVAPADGPNPAAELGSLQRRMHLMMLAGATLQGCLRHNGTLDDEGACAETVALLTRLGDLSWDWPGAGDRPAPLPKDP